jgi:pyridoxamine 5'-phosphate oxidase
MTQIGDLRHEYHGELLDISTVDPSPFVQFKKWFDETLKANIEEPNGMVLSTVRSDGMPSLRTVLLKAYDEEGYVFYTNYNSRKAREIEKNPKVALIFPWYDLHRQLIIQGIVKQVTKMESLKYFISRPFKSKLAAWVSNQSHVITSRNLLEMKMEEMKEKFKNGEVPLPDHWGGFKVIPETFEFWQGQPSRLHDRIYYSRSSGKDWKIERLAP